ncbi:MAG: histidine phosphatase family protein [Paracoccaceae bacterium]
MTVWHWVRHGPTHEKAFVGWRDVPADLSDKERLKRLAEYLPGDAFLVSSDLQRASATADAIGLGQTRLPHSTDIREFNFGEWDGQNFASVADAHPDLSRAYWETPGEAAPPGGESWNVAAARVNAFVDAMTRSYSGRHIIAVAHIGVILTQVQRANAWSPQQAISTYVDNLSVTRINWQTGFPIAEVINHNP